MILKKACAITLALSILSGTAALAATDTNNKQNSIDAQYQLQKFSKEISLTQYTYSNAPEDVRKIYEENCKAIGKEVNANDVIYVPSENKLSNNMIGKSVNATASSSYYVYKNGDRIDTNLSGSYSYFYIDSTYVGYNYITNGLPVSALQYLLTWYGYDVGVIDGIFGPKTHSALLNYQRNNGLSVDAICGPNTWRSFF